MAKRMIHSDESLQSFCTQIALIYESGLQLEDGLRMLEDSRTEIDIDKLAQNVHKTGKLSIAMAQDPGFPQELLRAMEAAETVGREDKVAFHLADYYRRQADTKRFMNDLLFMPVLLLSVLIVVMGVLSYAVLPVFQGVYANLGGVDNAWSILLLNGAKLFSGVGMVLLAIMLGWLIYQSIRISTGMDDEDLSEKMLRFFPQSKRLADLARFSFISQLLLEGGVEARSAMEMAIAQIPPGKLLDSLHETAATLKPSEGLYELITQAHIFPPLVQKTLSLAARAGKVDSMMDEVSRKTQAEAEASLSKTLNRVEPILVIALTAFVSAVLFSLLIPLLGIMSVLGS
ncbi:MAG: type II secretion system F family protein [Erysipelotrichaceae bacterium]